MAKKEFDSAVISQDGVVVATQIAPSEIHFTATGSRGWCVLEDEDGRMGAGVDWEAALEDWKRNFGPRVNAEGHVLIRVPVKFTTAFT